MQEWPGVVFVPIIFSWLPSLGSRGLERTLILGAALEARQTCPPSAFAVYVLACFIGFTVFLSFLVTFIYIAAAHMLNKFTAFIWALHLCTMDQSGFYQTWKWLLLLKVWTHRHKQAERSAQTGHFQKDTGQRSEIAMWLWKKRTISPGQFHFRSITITLDAWRWLVNADEMNMTQHLPSTFVAVSLVEITGVMVLFLVLLHFKSWVILEVSALDAWWRYTCPNGLGLPSGPKPDTGLVWPEPGTTRSEPGPCRPSPVIELCLGQRRGTAG